jgi:pyrroline-5-carboxylate reductase
MDESSLNNITVTAASGLAFAACMMNSYQKASNSLLNDDKKSKEITIRIFENVINMAKNEDSSFDDIVCRITTKGGTTEAGIKNLNQELITENLELCMRKSYEKANNIM